MELCDHRPLYWDHCVSSMFKLILVFSLYVCIDMTASDISQKSCIDLEQISVEIIGEIQSRFIKPTEEEESGVTTAVVHRMTSQSFHSGFGNCVVKLMDG